MGIAVRRVAVSAANPTIMARTRRGSLRFIATGRERKRAGVLQQHIEKTIRHAGTCSRMQCKDRIGVAAYEIGRRLAARADSLLVQAVRITDQSWLVRPT